MSALPRMSAIVMLIAAAPALSQVVTFEGSSFPDEQNWQRIFFCTPERWIEGGVFHQLVQPGECHPPPEGDQDNYTRSIAEFIGVSDFFVEWRLRVDGDASEIPWGAPAVLSAWNQGGETYWFAIARDQVKFVQDAFVVILFVEIAPDTPHTFRLEVNNDQWYVWYIDGVEIYAGAPGGPYPSANPSITWRARSAFLESSAHWDYIRYGTIAQSRGDFDSDGEVNLYDLYFFQECLTTEAGGWAGCAWADMDESGEVDCIDWQLFQEAWTDPVDPPGMPECDCPPGDLNCDGSVNPFDLATLLAAWGPCADCDECPPDLSGDCAVGPADLAMLLASWG